MTCDFRKRFQVAITIFCVAYLSFPGLVAVPEGSYAASQSVLVVQFPNVTWEKSEDGSLHLVGEIHVSAGAGSTLPVTVDARLVLRTPNSFAPVHVDWEQLERPVVSVMVKGHSESTATFPFAVSILSAEQLQREWWVEMQVATDPQVALELTLPWVGSQVIGRRTLPFPEVEGYRVLRGDFHIHTTMSRDAPMARSPKDRVYEAYEYGYDVIALTDHFHPYSYDLAVDAAHASGIILLRGMETGMVSLTGGEHFVALWEGDLDGYQPRDEHAWSRLPSGRTVFYQEQVRAIVESGGLLIYAHPTLDSGNLTEAVQWMLEHDMLAGVEYRGLWRASAFALALEHNLNLVEGSDTHSPRLGTNPREAPVTLILVDEISAQGVLDALRERRTLAWSREGNLVGHERWLAPFVRESVRVEAATGHIVLRNSSAIPLRGTIYIDGRGERFVLPSLGQAQVYALAQPTEVEIEWTNVWLRPNQPLRLDHEVLR